MLRAWTINCTFDYPEPARPDWGSLTHGMLLERLPDSIKESLHADGLRPFSQYVLASGKNACVWRVAAWDDAVSQSLGEVLNPGAKLLLKQKGIEMKLDQVTCEAREEADWAAPILTEDPPCRKYTLRLLTPCTHKSDGKYALFPTPQFIINGLYRRLGSFSNTISVDDTQAMKALCEHTDIVGYDLRSAIFSLEGARVTGYQGQVTLYLRGSPQIARLGGLILSFARFAGVGIKTSLGMGGCQVFPVPYRPKAN